MVRTEGRYTVCDAIQRCNSVARVVFLIGVGSRRGSLICWFVSFFARVRFEGVVFVFVIEIPVVTVSVFVIEVPVVTVSVCGVLSLSSAHRARGRQAT